MRGKVVSYISTKKYGFISGEDGESYFLHFSSLLDKANEKKLLKDVVVEFDPTPTPKGMSAKKVHVPNVYFKKNPIDFFMTKNSQPKYGVVEKYHSIETQFFKDPKEGREHIKKLAIESGCNAILNLNFEKNTFSSGNYRYTVHAFKGDLALVTESTPCDNERVSMDSNDELQLLISNFDHKFKRVQEMESEARRKQLESNYTALFVILGIIFFVLVIAQAN
ncbi:cold shock domain-containing protein [Shewanella sp.]|nr:cold shock domain-containing protein [Shewanella sp.]